MDTSSAEFQAALRDHAKSLGVDPDTERFLLGLVQEALLAELPAGWEQAETEDGTLYYFNPETEQSIWEHPLDAHYRELIQAKKKEQAEVAAAKDKAASTEAASTSTAPVTSPQTATSSIEVYSFDESSDDEDVRPMTKRAVNASSLTSNKPSDVSSTGQDRSSRLSALFGADTPASSSSTSALSRGSSSTTGVGIGSSAASSSMKGSSVFANDGGGFGRDRSWLLDGSDDDEGGGSSSFRDGFGFKRPTTSPASSLSSLPTSSGSAAATASSLVTSSGNMTGSRSSSTTSSVYSFSAHGDAAATATSSSTAPSRMLGTNTTPTGDNAVSALDMVLAASAAGPSSQKSPATVAASPASSASSPPRRAFGSTVKSQFFAQDSSTSSTSAMSGTSLAAAGLSALQSRPDASAAFTSGLVEQLEKQLAASTSENEALKRSLERAQHEAKEANYLKMKAGEAKSKLADKDAELAELRAKLELDKNVLAQTQRKLAQLQQQQSSSSASLDAKNREREEQLERDKEALSAAVSTLRGELEGANKQLEDAKKQLEDGHKQLAEAKQQLDDMKQQLGDSIESARRSAEAAKAAQEAQAAAKTAVSAKADAEALVLAGFAAKEQAWKAQEDSLTRSAKQHAEELEATREKLETAAKAHQQGLEKQQEALRKAEQRVKELERALEGERDRAVASSASTLRDLQRELEIKTRVASDAEEKLRTVDKQLHTAHAELGELRDKLETIQQQRNVLETTWRRDKQQREELQERLAQLEAQQQHDRREREERSKRERQETQDASGKLEAQVRELSTQLSQLKTRELAPLATQREALERERDSLHERVAALDRALRAAQLEATTKENAASQLQREVELLQRRAQQSRAQLEALAVQKDAGEQQAAALEAELAACKHDRRIEGDKLAFRLRELESQVAHREYETARVEEKFAAADAWRAKEARRVQERDEELLDAREQLAQLKARNVEAENSAVIAELRRAKMDLEHELDATRAQLESARAEVAEQLPQLARACVARTSDEWSKKLRASVAKVKEQWRVEALQERNALVARAQRAEEGRDQAERKLKEVAAEGEFLRKETRRLEDGNKELLDQLHTIRVYLTSYPRGFSGGCGGPAAAPSASPPPPTQQQSPPPPPSTSGAGPTGGSASLWGEAAAVGHLNAQLGILHAQFQQLLDANERARRPTVVTTGFSFSPSSSSASSSVYPFSSSDRFEIPSSPMHAGHSSGKQHELSPISEEEDEQLVDASSLRTPRYDQQHREKEALLASLETVGASTASSVGWTRPSTLVAALGGGDDDVRQADGALHSAWYQQNYWRRKYHT